MNSGPSSMGNGESGSSMVRMRPPIRSRASIHRTRTPRRARSLKAVSPAIPAPMISTSQSSFLLAFIGIRDFLEDAVLPVLAHPGSRKTETVHGNVDAAGQRLAESEGAPQIE